MIKEIIEIDGLEVTVTKKNIKSFNLRVNTTTGIVSASIPYAMSQKQVEEYVRKKMPWIKKHQKEINDTVLSYVTGELHYLWGEPYELVVIPNNEYSGASLRGQQIFLYCKASDSMEIRNQIMLKWYRNQLSRKIPTVMKACCKVVGKVPNEWRIKNMKTRWGTCNTRAKRVWINLQLVKYPPECLTFVITHELTHFYVHGHNKEFYNYMDQFYPNWKVVAQELRHRHG